MYFYIWLYKTQVQDFTVVAVLSASYKVKSFSPEGLSLGSVAPHEGHNINVRGDKIFKHTNLFCFKNFLLLYIEMLDNS